MQPSAASSKRVVDVRERALRTYRITHRPTLQVAHHLVPHDLHTVSFTSEWRSARAVLDAVNSSQNCAASIGPAYNKLGIAGLLDMWLSV
jgi:hypothetical protein